METLKKTESIDSANKQSSDSEESEILLSIKQGKIFIYPTDTIYGLGCDATNINSVNKIKLIKQRDRDKPLSIIAPSKGWIKENCQIPLTMNLNQYLPGHYTLILKKRNKDFLSHVSLGESIGIRIPNNDFTKQIQKSNLPFITTSVNLAGEKPITKTSEIKKQIKDKVDFIIDNGPLTGRPSTLVINGKEVKR